MLFHIFLSEKNSSSEIWNGTSYVCCIGTTVFPVCGHCFAPVTINYKTKKIILSSQKFFVNVCTMTGRRRKLIWYCDTFLATHCSQVRYMPQMWGGRKSQLEGVSGPNVFMASRTAPVSPFVVSFLIWIKDFLTFCPGHAPSHTKPVSNSRKTNRNRKEKVNVAHFQAVEASWSSLNSLGLLLDHFNTGQFHTQVFTVV